MRHATRTVARLGVLAALMFTGGCLKHWEVLEPTRPPDLRGTPKVRLTLAPDSVLILESPVISGGAIAGTMEYEECYPAFEDSRRTRCATARRVVSQPVQGIDGIETWETHTGNTVVLWIGIVGIPFSLWLLTQTLFGGSSWGG